MWVTCQHVCVIPACRDGLVGASRLLVRPFGSLCDHEGKLHETIIKVYQQFSKSGRVEISALLEGK